MDDESKDWPEEPDDENWEMHRFIEQYAEAPQGRILEPLAKVYGVSGPDYIVMDLLTGVEYGLELTAAYQNDRSVPDFHKKKLKKRVEYDPNEAELAEYKGRLVNTVRIKIQKARKKYDTSRPILLAIYVNEYNSIFLDRAEFEDIAKNNAAVFNDMAPFEEVIYWDLHDEGVIGGDTTFIIKPV